MSGCVTFNRAHIMRDGEATVVEDEHDAQLARVIRDLRGAAEHAQDVLERASQHHAAGNVVARGLVGADLVGEGASGYLSLYAIARCDDEWHTVLGENQDERGKLRVESLRRDEGAQVRGRSSA